MMPPSPSLRRSPSREAAHKRGGSFGSGLPAKPKDEELTLFTDMQQNERENFLLEPSENFDESICNISKLNYFLDFKLGVNVPTRGESRDLLNVDGDKNDYDWLLTPPETPLFRSLDDEEDQPTGPASRGRAQSKPISISRSSTMENTQRSGRSSASPNRLSHSPCLSSSAALARTRPLASASRSSPPPVLQPPTSSRRHSTPPAAKPLTPPRRSPSPASRRMSTGSSGPTLYGTRGASPVQMNRRSSSPKLQGWQSNIPGFTFDAPPNLRTSLPDRPSSRSRGASPSSFSGLDMASRGRRQSMSPTPSRRACSSHSNDRDRFSSYSKASATSSGEDDLDSMQSVPIGYSSSPAVKKNLAVMKTRTIASSKKPSKSFSPSSAPKRSFDSAVWLMDHRKAPQDMFRPLLSSVPATTLGAGKGNNLHRSMFSHNSSLTTSSNASSDHGATFGPYMDSDQEQHDLASEWEAADGSADHEDIFMFDKLDELNEDPSLAHHASTTRSGQGNLSITEKYVDSTRQDFDMIRTGAIIQNSYGAASTSEVGCGQIATCNRCGKLFSVMDVDGQGDLCEECALRVGELSANPKIQTLEEAHQQDVKNANSKPCAASELPRGPACIEDSREVCLDHQLVNSEPPAYCLQSAPPIQLTVVTTEEMLLEQQVKSHAENIRPNYIGDSSPGTYNDISFYGSSVSGCQQTEPTSVMEHDLSRDQLENHNQEMPQSLLEFDSQGNALGSETRTCDGSHQLGSIARPSLKVDNIEGTGISVLLLQKSSSNKWPVVEGRALAATNILCSEPYYTRDSANMMKSSIGCDSSPAASSSDLGCSRQADGCFERLMNGKRSAFEKAQMSSTISGQSIASMSDMSISNSSASVGPQNNANGDTCYPVDSLESRASRTMISSEEHDGSCKDALSNSKECSSAEWGIVNDESPVDLNISCLDRFGETDEGVVIQHHNAGIMTHEDNSNTTMCLLDQEVPNEIAQSSAAEEGCVLKTEDNVSGVTQSSSVSTPEHRSDENNFENLQMQSEGRVSDEANKLDNCISEEVVVSATETNTMELPDDEESPATGEGSREQIQRCFNLEEATDTILFCSSIIHDLAYKAATIGLEREQEGELAEPPHPTVTLVEKSFLKEDGLLKLPHRRTPNRKVKRKRLEGETITEAAEKEEGAKDPIPVRSSSEITRTSDSMKPPKLESKCNCTIM